MKGLRTQIYLSRTQREELDDLSRREKKTLAQVIRDAIDAYLRSKRYDPDEVDRILEETFGIDPNFSIPPREKEWTERDRRIWGDKPPR